MERSTEGMRLCTWPERILKVKSVPVGDPTDASLQPLIGVMLDILYATDGEMHGMGLASNQANWRGPGGRPERVIVFDTNWRLSEGGAIERRPRALINPVVGEAAGFSIGEEGCLSFPGIRGRVVRAGWIRVHGFDRTGNPVTMTVGGQAANPREKLLCRVIQHEIDHLDGRNLPDYMSGRSRRANKARLKALERRGP